MTDTRKAPAIRTDADALAWIAANRPHADVRGLRVHEKTVCHRCGGTGIYSQYHGTCFACGGVRSKWTECPTVIAYARRHRKNATARANREAKRMAAHAAQRVEGQAWLEANGLSDAVAAIDPETRTGAEQMLLGLASSCHQFGSLTEKQLAFARSLVVEIADRKAADADKINAPTGRLEITGEVVSRKFSENAYGLTDRITVLVETVYGHWILNCTTPAALTGTRFKRGDTVRLTATITPSDTDPSFAFGKRPTKASVVTTTADGEVQA